MRLTDEEFEAFKATSPKAAQPCRSHHGCGACSLDQSLWCCEHRCRPYSSVMKPGLGDWLPMWSRKKAEAEA